MFSIYLGSEFVYSNLLNGHCLTSFVAVTVLYFTAPRSDGFAAVAGSSCMVMLLPVSSPDHSAVGGTYRNTWGSPTKGHLWGPLHFPLLLWAQYRLILVSGADGLQYV